MKTVSTKKGQLTDEQLKAFIIIVRSDFVAFLQLVKADKKAPLTQEETEYWRRVFAERYPSLLRQQIESDYPDFSLDSDFLTHCLYTFLSSI